jgi:hypothetical protein
VTWFWWETSQRETGNTARCFTLVAFLYCGPEMGWHFWETAALPQAATFCLQCAFSLGREGWQWDKCQMASSVTPYRMPLIVEWRRPFSPTSRGKTRVSWLQGRQRCADAGNKTRPGAASSSGGGIQTPRAWETPPCPQHDENQREAQ